eukprot:TRINITY_DN6823_c0_g1_i1.p1 TRINITY_DN6823_c0_g1~~TRINITY_DN6823_c0_g1_i1.p1  ORF type:complete len:316 (-),score=136.25 TRINITY_DN6823_c0_g1_i1:287-1234(-)
MDPDFRKAQMERGKAEGRLASFVEVSFDKDLYSGGGGANFDTSIAVNFDDDDETEASHPGVNSRKKFMQSFSGSKKFFEEMTGDDDNDPFKETRRKTIAEREDEYRARWRKRARLSPQQLDPFAAKKAEVAPKKGKAVADPGAGARTYKEIMMEQLLEKEKADVLRRIAEKEKREKEEAEQREREKEERKLAEAKAAKKAKKSGNKWDVMAPAKQWRLDAIKNDTVVESHELDRDSVYELGRNYNAHIKLLHESCSKHHAKISFADGVPTIVDLNSSNGTIVNGAEIRPDLYTPLKNGDRIRFGCSTREFIIREV